MHIDKTFPAVNGRAVLGRSDPTTIAEARQAKGDQYWVDTANGVIDQAAGIADVMRRTDNQAEDMNRQKNVVVVTGKDVNPGDQFEQEGTYDAAVTFRPAQAASMLPMVLTMEVDNPTPSEYNYKWTYGSTDQGERLTATELDRDRPIRSEVVTLSPDGQTLNYTCDME